LGDSAARSGVKLLRPGSQNFKLKLFLLLLLEPSSMVHEGGLAEKNNFNLTLRKKSEKFFFSTDGGGALGVGINFRPSDNARSCELERVKEERLWIPLTENQLLNWFKDKRETKCNALSLSEFDGST
jgi:hypothetical protein